MLNLPNNNFTSLDLLMAASISGLNNINYFVNLLNIYVLHVSDYSDNQDVKEEVRSNSAFIS